MFNSGCRIKVNDSCNFDYLHGKQGVIVGWDGIIMKYCVTIDEEFPETILLKESDMELVDSILPKHENKPDVNIRKQNHYTQFKIQPVVFISENNLDFLTGNVIKYVCRHNLKNGVEDLEKAKHYLDMLISKEKGESVI